MKKQLIIIAIMAASLSQGQTMFAQMFGKAETPIPAVAWYKLDGNALDSSGNGYTGTVKGAVVTNGYFGQGYYFGGAAAVIDRATSQGLVNGASGTVCFWMKADSRETKYTWSVAQNGQAFFWSRRESDGRVSARLYQGSQAFWVYSTSKYSAGTWVHVAFRWGVTGWKISINGAPEGTDANTTAVNLGASTLTVGAQYPDIPMNGSMDDVRIFDRALSVANIQRIMTGQSVQPVEELQ